MSTGSSVYADLLEDLAEEAAEVRPEGPGAAYSCEARLMASSLCKRLVASLVWCNLILLVNIRSALSKLRAFMAYLAKDRHFWASSAFISV